jgi:hypothetical protein
VEVSNWICEEAGTEDIDGWSRIGFGFISISMVFGALMGRLRIASLGSVEDTM